MSEWVVKFRRPMRRDRSFSEMLRTAGKEKKRRKWRDNTDRTAEPLLKRDAAWQPRDPTSFALGETVRYWTGRYWTEQYDRAMRYPNRDDAEAEIFRLCALDTSLLQELETDEWAPVSKPAAKQAPPVIKPPPAPITVIVSKPKR